MKRLSSIWRAVLQLITRGDYRIVAPRYFLNVSPVPLETTPHRERRRPSNFNGQWYRRSVRRQFPMLVILSLLAFPLSTASADILYVTDFSDGLIRVIDTDDVSKVIAPISVGVDESGDPLIPWCIAVTKDGKSTYISTDPFVLNDGGNAFIIDTVTHTVSGGPFRIPAGSGGHPCVVISPDGTRAYLSNGSSVSPVSNLSEMVAIPTTENPPVTEVFNVNTGNYTTGRFALSPDGSTLYALNSNPLHPDIDKVLKIDGVDGVSQSLTKITFSEGFSRIHSDLDVTADGKFLYVTNGMAPTIQVWDADPVTTRGIREIQLADTDFASGIVIAPERPDGRQFVYVALPVQGQILAIDTANIAALFDGPPSNEPIPIEATIVVGNFPVQIAITPDGETAYVTNAFDGDVTVIDTATNTVVGLPIVAGELPYRIAVVAPAAGSGDPVASLDSFQCLEARKLYTPRRYKYKKFGGITHLKLGARGLQPENFCSPVDVFPVGDEGQGLSNPPNPHLSCYEKNHWKHSKHFGRWGKDKKDNGYKRNRHRADKQEITINNLFGDQTLRVSSRPNNLCLPSGKGDEPTPEPEALDHFKCFEAKKVRGTHLENRKVTIDDGTESTNVKVVKSVAFCAPVDGDDMAIVDAIDFLACYKVRVERSHKHRYGKRGYWKHRFRSEKIIVNNDLAEGQKLKVSELETICVPSTILIVQSPPPRTHDDDKDDDDDDHKKKSKMDDDDDD